MGQRYDARILRNGQSMEEGVTYPPLPLSRPPDPLKLIVRNSFIVGVEQKIILEKDPILKRALKVLAFYFFHETTLAPETLHELDGKTRKGHIRQLTSDIGHNWYGSTKQLGDNPSEYCQSQ